MKSSRPTAGFTLIEILIAVALLAVIGVLGYRGLDQIRLASTVVLSEAETWQRLNGIFARLGHDLNQALSSALAPTPYPTSTFWAQGELRQTAIAGNEFSFLRPAATGHGVQRIAYRFERPMSSQATNTGVWQLLIWPGREATGEARSVVLLDGINQLEIAALDQQGQWWSQWPAGWQQTLPRALRVTLTLADQRQISRIFDLPTGN